MTKAQKIQALHDAKTDALEAREDFARFGMWLQVQECNAFIASCNAKLDKLKAP